MPMREVDVSSSLKRRLLRLVVVAIVAVAVYLTADALGVFQYLDPRALAERVRDSGPLGVLVFVAAFCVGEVTQAPATVFFAAAVGVWGLPAGALVAVVAAITACTFAFASVRVTGRWILQGRSLEALQRYAPYIESAPLRTTILLRLVLGAAPPVNWALALAAIGWRDFLLGTAIGMTPNVAIYVWLLDQIAFASDPLLPAWAVIILLLAVVSAGALTLRAMSRGERG
jgi:phospholipase D1/2